MHASSLENMQKCYENYICGQYFTNKNKIKVLDVGGANVNGSYSDVFSNQKFHYIAADIQEADGVDLVFDDPYTIPCADESIDVLISGQAFEHVEFFWVLFEEMVRVIKNDGWIFLIAPSAGPIHRFPVDCYRFYPDAYRALAKYTQINLVEVTHDNRGPWNDLTGVFSKDFGVQKLETRSWVKPLAHEINRYIENTLPVSTLMERQADAIEKIQGQAFYLETLTLIHQRLNPANYLEIGIRVGKSLALSQCPTLAIDPSHAVCETDFPNTQFFSMTSDYFFKKQTEIIDKNGIDLAFIDGMHLFEFVLRDFINIERHSHKNTVVVIDDVFPNNATQALRFRKSQVWTGDVWKIIVCLMLYRKDLCLHRIDTSPTGLLVISNLKRNNMVLLDHYNPIVRKFKDEEITNYKDLILNRKNAKSPNDPNLLNFLDALK